MLNEKLKICALPRSVISFKAMMALICTFKFYLGCCCFFVIATYFSSTIKKKKNCHLSIKFFQRHPQPHCPHHHVFKWKCTLCDMPLWVFFCLLVCFGPYPWHIEVPRLGVKLELQLPAYTTATAAPDLSLVCDLHRSSQQRRILNPLREARDPTHNLMVPSRIHFCSAMMGTPICILIIAL